MPDLLLATSQVTWTADELLLRGCQVFAMFSPASHGRGQKERIGQLPC